MHGAGVIGDEKAAGAEICDQLRQLGFADTIGVANLIPHELGELFAHLGFPWGTVEDPFNVGMIGGDLLDDLSKAVERPAFGLSVFGPSADADFEARTWRSGRLIGRSLLLGFLGKKRGDVRTAAFGDVEVAEGVVKRGTEDFFRLFDDLSQESRAKGAFVTNEARDACEPEFEGGAGGICEKDGGIKADACAFDPAGHAE